MCFVLRWRTVIKYKSTKQKTNDTFYRLLTTLHKIPIFCFQMATSIINNGPYLKKERVGNLMYPELIICSLCKGLLWLPKSCVNCETSYCSLCIKKWQAENSEPIICPKPCSGFSERNCPAAVVHILNTLEVKCRNTLYGCNETLRYTSLETHEEVCGYRQMTCDGCQQEIARQDFQEHNSTCLLVLLECPECATVYQRQYEESHTETTCLREQLIQQKKRLDKLERLVDSLTGNMKQLR